MYLTVEQSILANGDRHKANADRYELDGKPEYAAGSRAKAKRNYARAAAMNVGADLPPIIADYFNRMAQRMASDMARNLFSA